jgi:thiamine biosynthesis protein ThiI
MEPVILVHYGEIGLKGRNREMFERLLVKNLSASLTGHHLRVRRAPGRILLSQGREGRGSRSGSEEIAQRLRQTFGVENFAFGLEGGSGMEEVKRSALVLIAERLREAHPPASSSTFCIRAKRADKRLPFSSVEVNQILGQAVLEAHPHLRVRLSDPHFTVHVEMTSRRGYVFLEKHDGPGGLPVGASGRVLCLISGGIDSPVAAWYMMKRGCLVDFIHFPTPVAPRSRRSRSSPGFFRPGPEAGLAPRSFTSRLRNSKNASSCIAARRTAFFCIAGRCSGGPKNGRAPLGPWPW